MLSFAAMIRFYKGEWKGETLPVNDSEDVVAFFAEVWKCDNASDVANTVLANAKFWGEDLTKIEGMVESVRQSLEEVERSFDSVILSSLVDPSLRNPPFWAKAQ